MIKVGEEGFTGRLKAVPEAAVADNRTVSSTGGETFHERLAIFENFDQIAEFQVLRGCDQSGASA
ncbi:hypothetical protein HY17_08015 [Hyphomonas sp. CY54-11-8]|nr:hypothetical protein HY17_08015 [Hyphomonas sp. CY54-11-8]